MTSSSWTRAPSSCSRSVSCATVGRSRWSRSVMPERKPGRPPAKWKSSIRYVCPPGRTLASTGTVRAMRSKSSSVSVDAGAARHGDQVDDGVGGAAEAEDRGDRVLEGVRGEDRRQLPSPARPVPRSAGRPRRPSGRARSRRPGCWRRPGPSCRGPRRRRSLWTPYPSSCSGRASGPARSPVRAISQSPMRPARLSSQYFHMSVPEPRVSPRQCPGSIGPAGTKTAGRSTLAAPISSAGVDLSQPPISTAPSTG